MTTAVIAYSATEAAIADLVTMYKGVVYDVTTPEGMFVAKAAYKDINTHSITLEKAREKEKAESLAYGRWVDSEAKRIAEQLDALRLPIKAQIETETKRIEREKEEVLRKETERLAAEQKAIKDAEEAKMAAERAEIARQQEELRKSQQEAAKQIEEAQRISRLKIEEEERTARLAREEADRQSRLAQQARDEVARVKAQQEEERLKAERDKIETARREAEAVEREAKRKESELLDATQMLSSFVSRFGHLPRFQSIVGLIEAFLADKEKAA